jgi:hypothetical protein
MATAICTPIAVQGIWGEGFLALAAPCDTPLPLSLYSYVGCLLAQSQLPAGLFHMAPCNAGGGFFGVLQPPLPAATGSNGGVPENNSAGGSCGPPETNQEAYQLFFVQKHAPARSPPPLSSLPGSPPPVPDCAPVNRETLAAPATAVSYPKIFQAFCFKEPQHHYPIEIPPPAPLLQTNPQHPPLRSPPAPQA